MMHKLFAAALLASCLCAGTAFAQQPEKKGLTPEQKKVRADVIAKYDTNKDGKLDKEERAKMTREDQEKLKANSGGGKNKQADKAKQKKEK